MDKRKSKPIFETFGWMEPENSKLYVHLVLENDVEVSGNYQGEDIYSVNDQIIELVLIKSGNQIIKLPKYAIVQTTIYPAKKDRAVTGFLIGLSIDAIILVMAAQSLSHMNLLGSSGSGCWVC